nr:hypothetical protein [Tanacetum cinerariifolium]
MCDTGCILYTKEGFHVVVVAIVGVVIVVVIIGVLVIGDVSYVLKLLFVVIGNPQMKTSMSFLEFGTMFGHKTANSWNLLMQGDNRMSDSIGGLVFLVTKVGENQMALDDKLGYPLMIISRDEHLTHLVPREMVYFPVVMESNSDNTGGITVGEAIGACSRGIGNLVASYACMTPIYGSLYKGDKTSEAKRYLDKLSGGSGEMFPGEAGK